MTTSNEGQAVASAKEQVMNSETSNLMLNEATRAAKQDSLLSPRFYTTDFKAMDRLDVSSIRGEWEELMTEFRNDTNRRHFHRNEEFSTAVSNMPEELREEFLAFLISSITSEFSGCILYADIKTNVTNPDIRTLMGFMSRDEARHANFINQSLEDFDLAVDLGLLRKTKNYTFFKPKFIFYATYLSEKIGYARYITIYRQLERNPQYRFHPIFNWFKDWCNDEFRHGEGFSLLMHANPHLLKWPNTLWIRFFVLAVFATMYVRDHDRPHFYAALGLDPTEYDFTVFRITSEIARQVFPITLDIENPKFKAGLERLRKIDVAKSAADARGGLFAPIKKAALTVSAVATFARLYFLPAPRTGVPAEMRLTPAW